MSQASPIAGCVVHRCWAAHSAEELRDLVRGAVDAGERGVFLQCESDDAYESALELMRGDDGLRRELRGCRAVADRGLAGGTIVVTLPAGEGAR